MYFLKTLPGDNGCTIWGALGALLPGNFKENQALAGNLELGGDSQEILERPKAGNIDDILFGRKLNHNV
jgi:hypothetical protein